MKTRILITLPILLALRMNAQVPNPAAAVPTPIPYDNPRQVGSGGIPAMGALPAGGFITPLPAVSDVGMGANFPTSWADRRPIGVLYLTNSGGGVLYPPNPANWTMNGDVTLWDYSTTAGLSAIQAAILSYANLCLANMQKVGAQGIVVWDTQGEQFGGLTYWGQPSAIPWSVPEFDQVSDEFWNVFKAAGMRIGVALRADIADFHSDGSHSEDHYTTIGQAEADLDAKLSYAHDRWGCTLFYVDSNGGIEIGGSEPGQVYPATIFQYLQQKHPDCLIMPEGHYGNGGIYGSVDNYYLWTAGYGQYRLGDPQKDASDLASVPGSFMAVDISDSGLSGSDQTLINFVKAGGVLLFRAWWDNNNEQESVSSIYQAAGSGGPSPTPSVTPTPSPSPVQSNCVPQYDHIVVVVEENEGWNDIVAANPPYIMGTLYQVGAAMTASYAVAHPSEPNYFALYAGDTFGVIDDNNYNESGPTLASVLRDNSLDFIGYVENSASNDQSPDASTLAARKHNPWESFGDDQGVEQDFSTFPSDFTQLPQVSFVIPNQNDDMHNGDISGADSWLQSHLGAYAQWAVANNSLLIVTWDEDSSASNGGLTSPPNNRIMTLLYGSQVSSSAPSNQQITHYNVLAMILAASGVPQTQWPRNAANATPINGVFTTQSPSPVPSPSPHHRHHFSSAWRWHGDD